jgi:hypothetical protein
MEPDENRVLAESVMNLIIRLVDVHVKKQDEAPAQVCSLLEMVSRLVVKELYCLDISKGR